MARGQKAEVGTERVAPNGYHYTRTETGWRLTHHIVAEKMLGRPLRTGERVSFKDGKRSNFRDPNNLVISVVGGTDTVLKRRLANLEDRRREIDAEITQIKKKLNE